MMTPEPLVEITVEYHVMVEYNGRWVDLPGFSSHDLALARAGVTQLRELGQQVTLLRDTTVQTLETLDF